MRAATSTFLCQRCGNCCRESGYVYITEDEVGHIAGMLGLDVVDFTNRFARLTHDRKGLSLTEKPNGECVFLRNGCECAIESVKPEQCRGFPFTWRYSEVGRICEGWVKYERR
jgi:Fe-S-cluster containining protein